MNAMGQKYCFLCKGILSTKIKYNIENTYTPASNILLKSLVENVINDKIPVTSPLEVCHSCYCLLKDLDETQTKCRRICDKLCYYLGYKCESKDTDTVCQTDTAPSKTKGNDTEREEIENETKQYDCTTCSKKFASRAGLVTHIKRQHPKYVENAKRSKIEDVFIKSEIEDDTRGDDYSSANDNDNFAHDSDSESEKDEKPEQPKKKRGRKKKNPDELKPHKCTKCSKTWRTQAELKNHLSSHSTDRPFICEICGHAYKHKSALDVHVSMHNGVSPHMCVHCNKCFTQRGGLQRHMPIHTGNKSVSNMERVI